MKWRVVVGSSRTEKNWNDFSSFRRMTATRWHSENELIQKHRWRIWKSKRRLLGRRCMTSTDKEQRTLVCWTLCFSETSQDIFKDQRSFRHTLPKHYGIWRTDWTRLTLARFVSTWRPERLFTWRPADISFVKIATPVWWMMPPWTHNRDALPAEDRFNSLDEWGAVVAPFFLEC